MRVKKNARNRYCPKTIVFSTLKRSAYGSNYAPFIRSVIIEINCPLVTSSVAITAQSIFRRFKRNDSRPSISNSCAPLCFLPDVLYTVAGPTLAANDARIIKKTRRTFVFGVREFPPEPLIGLNFAHRNALLYTSTLTRITPYFTRRTFRVRG